MTTIGSRSSVDFVQERLMALKRTTLKSNLAVLGFDTGEERPFSAALTGCPFGVLAPEGGRKAQ